jgi:coatomer subunit beta'
LLLFYSSYGDEDGLKKLVEDAEKNGKYNVALEAAYLLGDAERCITILLKSKRVAEAAMFARAYAPSKVTLVMKQWEETLK